MKIAFVGCGNMGTAFAKSFVKYQIVDKQNLLLIQNDPQILQKLKEEDIGMTSAEIGAEIAGYEIVLIGVKPQSFSAVAPLLKKHLTDKQLVISIMAGVRLHKIQEALNHQEVIRAMPNTPAKIGMGVTGLTAAEAVSNEQVHKAENVLNATGRTVYIENENQLDAVTAISGSGPAYFYYFVKSMIDAAKALGLDDATASLLVKQTMHGSFHLINNTNKPLDELIQSVASKGGTTEAALNVFDEKQLGDIIQDAIFSASKRAEALSKPDDSE